ncbi:porin family protein [Parapedobacter sp. ISTM3]|uniref:porin family protein n=1 Tax=Parapedobacter sp. ISTM3 TaxID=2800130 RepID=UPI001F3607CC|nr:porin family protein [Parapedobacter sp. ISTM3]
MQAIATKNTIQMKKYFIIALLSTFTAIGANAQLLPTFQLGLKGALNFSTLRTDDGNWLDGSTRTGYQAGIWARIGGAGVHFQPELYFTGKSSKAEFDNPEGGNVTANVTFTSLDLPLLLGTRIGLGPLGVRVQAGPVVSFVVDEGIGQALQDVADFNSYKSQAWAVTGGIGVDISKFRADLRYEHGLSNLSENSNRSQKINLWSLGVGYRLF